MIFVVSHCPSKPIAWRIQAGRYRGVAPLLRAAPGGQRCDLTFRQVRWSANWPVSTLRFTDARPVPALTADRRIVVRAAA